MICLRFRCWNVTSIDGIRYEIMDFTKMYVFGGDRLAVRITTIKCTKPDLA